MKMTYRQWMYFRDRTKEELGKVGKSLDPKVEFKKDEFSWDFHKAYPLTKEEFEKEGEKRFGSDQMNWRFKCPSCGYVASVQDYKDARASSATVGFSCIGRYLPGKCQEAFTNGPGPCNYAGGGLFRLNPVEIDGKYFFEFADPK